MQISVILLLCKITFCGMAEMLQPSFVHVSIPPYFMLETHDSVSLLWCMKLFHCAIEEVYVDSCSSLPSRMIKRNFEVISSKTFGIFHCYHFSHFLLTLVGSSLNVDTLNADKHEMKFKTRHFRAAKRRVFRWQFLHPHLHIEGADKSRFTYSLPTAS